MRKLVQSFLIAAVSALMLMVQAHAADKEGAAEQPPERVEEALYATVETNLGKMVIKLFPRVAPISVENFLRYVDRGFYEDTIFHRVIPGFMVQGGGFNKQFQRKPTSRPIRNESNNGLKNLRGSVAMARTGDPNSATSQFFINLADNVHLDAKPGEPGYAVFGELVSGINVIDSMAVLKQGKYRGTFHNAPNETVWIVKAYRSDPKGNPLNNTSSADKAADKP